MPRQIGDLPHALGDGERFTSDVAGRRPAVVLDNDDVVPIYLGDDLTDEDAFEALSGKGVGVFVGRADDPETEGRISSADYALHTFAEVERFLDTLAR